MRKGIKNQKPNKQENNLFKIMRRNNFFKNEKFWQIFATFSVVLFVVIAIFGYQHIKNFYNYIFNSRENIEQEKKISCTNCVRRAIDGVYVKKGNENPYPIAVVIDNHEDARPAAGLSHANLVYEAEAEGRITRYLAFFASGENVEKIGPIRSARPYFLDWLSEFSALFVHCGGSPEALAQIIKKDIKDLNEFYNEKYYWRANDREAPHNVMTSMEKLKNYLNNRNFKTGKYFSWIYKDDQPAKENLDNNIKIFFKSPNYVPEWKYDAKNNEYIRYLDNQPHQDEDGNQITAKNIIIQFIGLEVIDDEFRVRMDTIGGDEAIICLDGNCQKGTWKKTGAGSRTRYYDADGKEIEFNAGTTWIEVVRNNAKENVEIN